MRIDRVQITVQPAGWLPDAVDVVVGVKTGGVEAVSRKLVPVDDFHSRFDLYLQMIAEELREHFTPDEVEEPIGSPQPPTPSV